jgi:hypothetical protein
MEISQLCVRLHSQVHCQICQHQFVLSLTPGAPAPDAPRRDSQTDAFFASEPADAPPPEGPRKAKPPFRALVEPEVPVATPKPVNCVAPFAPLPEIDFSTIPGRHDPDGSRSGTRKNRSAGRWWKGLSDRQQKMVLGAW